MKKQIVTIVGRPNVGKSTLFNRLIRKREAITDNTPGVTRDRNYAETDWAGVDFTLIDTGGYLPDRENAIQKAVVTQVLGAIDEADAIVFLVDAQAGLTSIDFEITNYLIRSEKPVLLAVNKIDNEAAELNVSEFYQLGLGEPFPLSAISGRNVGDFLDEVVKLLPRQASDFDIEADESAGSIIRLAVVGRPNVGKSSLVNAILGVEKQIVTAIPGTTRDAIDSRFKHHGQEFSLIDTAGIRRRSRVKESIEYYSVIRSFDSIKRCHVAIVMIDAVEGLTDQDKTIIEEVIRNRKGIILAVNKWDLIEKDNKTAQEYEKALLQGLRGEKFIPIIFISVIVKQRLHRVIEMVKSIHQERAKRLQTSELNNFFKQIIEKFPPPDFGRHQVKINYCTQVKASPPIFAFFLNFPQAIKDNYKKYLENKIREQYGFWGIPITLVFKRK